MQKESSIRSPLNDVQLMLLRLFSRPMSQSDTEAIRKMLLAYYETQLQQELDRAIEEKNIRRSDFERVLNQDRRTP